MPVLVSHPDEVKIISRRFGQGGGEDIADTDVEVTGQTHLQHAGGALLLRDGEGWVTHDRSV